MKVEIGKSKRNDKRLVAVFFDNDGNKVKTTHFGLKNPKFGTFIDHKDKDKKENYLKRHRVREDWNDYQNHLGQLDTLNYIEQELSDLLKKQEQND